MTPFAQLCLLLRCSLGNSSDPAREIAEAGLDGDALIELSVRTKVAPFLRSLAVDPAIGPALPATLRDALLLVYKANRTRNRHIRIQIGEILGLLNAEGIVPVLLKGGARVIDGTYPDWGGRFMHDLDILIDEPEIARAFTALERGRYAPLEREGQYPDEYHHLPTLSREGVAATVELHRGVVEHWRAELLPASAMIARSQEVDFEGKKARLATVSDSIVHLIAHGELQHQRFLSGEVGLSDIVELVLLVRRGDVTELQLAFDRAAAAGEALSFAAFLHLCERVTGERLDVKGIDSRLSKLFAARALWQQGHPLAQKSGHMLVFAQGALAFSRYPSLLRRFPGRLAEAGFYRNRWRQFRRLMSR